MGRQRAGPSHEVVDVHVVADSETEEASPHAKRRRMSGMGRMCRAEAVRIREPTLADAPRATSSPFHPGRNTMAAAGSSSRARSDARHPVSEQNFYADEGRSPAQVNGRLVLEKQQYRNASNAPARRVETTSRHFAADAPAQSRSNAARVPVSVADGWDDAVPRAGAGRSKTRENAAAGPSRSGPSHASSPPRQPYPTHGAAARARTNGAAGGQDQRPIEVEGEEGEDLDDPIAAMDTHSGRTDDKATYRNRFGARRLPLGMDDEVTAPLGAKSSPGRDPLAYDSPQQTRPHRNRYQQHHDQDVYPSARERDEARPASMARPLKRQINISAASIDVASTSRSRGSDRLGRVFTLSDEEPERAEDLESMAGDVEMLSPDEAQWQMNGGRANGKAREIERDRRAERSEVEQGDRKRHKPAPMRLRNPDPAPTSGPKTRSTRSRQDTVPPYMRTENHTHAWLATLPAVRIYLPGGDCAQNEWSDKSITACMEVEGTTLNISGNGDAHQPVTGVKLSDVRSCTLVKINDKPDPSSLYFLLPGYTLPEFERLVQGLDGLRDEAQPSQYILELVLPDLDKSLKSKITACLQRSVHVDTKVVTSHAPPGIREILLLVDAPPRPVALALPGPGDRSMPHGTEVKKRPAPRKKIPTEPDPTDVNQPLLQFAKRTSARLSGQPARLTTYERPGAHDRLPGPAKPDKIIAVWPAKAGLRAEINLTAGDLHRLEEREFLNDTLIEYGLKDIVSRLPGWIEEAKAQGDAMREEPPDICSDKDVHVFNSFFFKKLVGNRQFPTTTAGQEAALWPGYESVKKWTSKVDIFTKRFVLVPVNEHFHWYMLVICNPGKALFKSRELPPSTPPALRLTRSSRTMRGRASESVADECAVSEELGRPSPGRHDAAGVESAPGPVSGQEEDVDMASLSRVSSPLVQGGLAKREVDGSCSASAEPIEVEESASFRSIEDLTDEEEACIIAFDSLAGSHPRSAQWLNRWLAYEALDKAKVPSLLRSGEKEPLPYCDLIVPEQPNYCDCGIYLLHFAEILLRHPKQALKLIAEAVRRSRPRKGAASTAQLRLAADRDWQKEAAETGGRLKWKERVRELAKQYEPKSSAQRSENGLVGTETDEPGDDAQKLPVPTAATGLDDAPTSSLQDVIAPSDEAAANGAIVADGSTVAATGAMKTLSLEAPVRQADEEIDEIGQTPPPEHSDAMSIARHERPISIALGDGPDLANGMTAPEDFVPETPNLQASFLPDNQSQADSAVPTDPSEANAAAGPGAPGTRLGEAGLGHADVEPANSRHDRGESQIKGLLAGYGSDDVCSPPRLGNGPRDQSPKPNIQAPQNSSNRRLSPEDAVEGPTAEPDAATDTDDTDSLTSAALKPRENGQPRTRDHTPRPNKPQQAKSGGDEVDPALMNMFEPAAAATTETDTATTGQAGAGPAAPANRMLPPPDMAVAGFNSVKAARSGPREDDETIMAEPDRTETASPSPTASPARSPPAPASPRRTRHASRQTQSPYPAAPDGPSSPKSVSKSRGATFAKNGAGPADIVTASPKKGNKRVRGMKGDKTYGGGARTKARKDGPGQSAENAIALESSEEEER